MSLFSRAWIAIASITIITFLPVLKPEIKPELQETPLVVSIVPAHLKTTCGDVTEWNFILHNTAPITVSEISIMDGSNWAWATVPSSQFMLTTPQDLIVELSVIPLAAGTLQPSLSITYQYNGQTLEQLVTSDLVQVTSVSEQVSAEIVVNQKTIRESDTFTVNLWLTNQSPFTLTQISVDGFGIDIAWTESPITGDLRSKENILLPVQGIITGSRPQPQLLLHYYWSDAFGHTNEYSQYIVGIPLEISKEEPAWWERISGELYAAFLGLIIGIVSSSIISWLKDRWDRKLKEKYIRSKLRGMLQMLALQAEHAAEKGTLIDAQVVETIFQSDELYDILLETKLTDSVRDLWKLAQVHNENLNRPAGAQRSEKLNTSARNLNASADLLSSPKRTRIIEWMLERLRKIW